MTRTLWLVCILGMACGKGNATKDPPKGDPSAVPSASAASATPAASSSPATTMTGTQVAAPTTVSTATQVKPGTSAGTTAPSVTVAAPLPPGAGMHVDGNNFAVDIATPLPCDKGTTCQLQVRLTAKGEFHVNKEYPYKLKMDDAPGTEFGGTDAQGKTTFSKAAGNFAFAGEKSGIMTVMFKPSTPGALAMSGTLKLSVCNASNCMLETAQVRATVPVR